MAINNPETLNHVDIESRVNTALTPEQKKRLTEKGITDITKGNIAELRWKLGADGADIVKALEGILPAGSIAKEKMKPKYEPTFLKNPVDWASAKIDQGKEWVVNLIPERPKVAAEQFEAGNILASATTLVAGKAAGEQVVQAQETAKEVSKAVDNWKRFAESPWEFIKGFFAALFSGNLKSFLGVEINLGSQAEKLADFLKVPKDLTKKAKEFLVSESFTAMKYSELAKIYNEYKKDPANFNLAEKIKDQKLTTPEIATILEQMFGEKTKTGFLEQVSAKSDGTKDIRDLAMSEIMSLISA